MEPREREPAPAVEHRRQEPDLGGIFFLFFFSLFWGGNRNFPCRRSLLPKNVLFSGGSGKKEMSQGSALVRKCPRRQGRVAWSHLAGTAGKVRASQPGQPLGNKLILRGSECYSCPLINAVVISTGLVSMCCGRENENESSIVMLQVSMRWQQGKKKKKSRELPLSSTRI